MSRAGARTCLQLMGHGDMQGFDSSFLALYDPAMLQHHLFSVTYGGRFRVIVQNALS